MGRNRLVRVSNDDRHTREDGPEPDRSARSAHPSHGAPASLVGAACLTFVEGLLTVAFGVTEALSLDSDRLVMGVSTCVFFLAYGAGLVACAWGMNRVRPWSRGPVLLAQLIRLGLAWNFRAGDTRPLAIGLALMAVAVLAGLLHPRSIDALERAAAGG
jgi:hypothetical protein